MGRMYGFGLTALLDEEGNREVAGVKYTFYSHKVGELPIPAACYVINYARKLLLRNIQEQVDADPQNPPERVTAVDAWIDHGYNKQEKSAEIDASFENGMKIEVDFKVQKGDIWTVGLPLTK